MSRRAPTPRLNSIKGGHRSRRHRRSMVFPAHRDFVRRGPSNFYAHASRGKRVSGRPRAPTSFIDRRSPRPARAGVAITFCVGGRAAADAPFLRPTRTLSRAGSVLQRQPSAVPLPFLGLCSSPASPSPARSMRPAHDQLYELENRAWHGAGAGEGEPAANRGWFDPPLFVRNPSRRPSTGNTHRA